MGRQTLSASRPRRHQHTTHFAKGSWPVWEELQPLLAEGEVKRRIWKRYGTDVPFAPLDLCALRRRERARDR